MARNNKRKGGRFRKDDTTNKRGNESISCTNNDASWYSSNSQLLNDSASYSFNNALGSRISGVDSKDFSVPGVLALGIVPTIGKSTDSVSPVNIAARNIYSYVRHANSGHSNYEAPDLMMYLLAMDSLYSFHAWMCRLYGILNVYSQVNRYLPKALLMANHCDYSSFVKQLADFRYYINNFAVKIGSLCTPNSMSYFTRHAWMYTNVFTDASTTKSQMYLYVPQGFYLYQPTTDTTGGKLEFRRLSNNMTLSNIITFGDTLVNAVMRDEDMNIMSGDILKAFGDNGVMKVGTINSEYSVLPVFNAEVLQQIENAIVYPMSSSVQIRCDITQKNSDIVCEPKFLYVPGTDSIACGPFTRNFMLNMHIDSPNPSDVMVATRLMASSKVTWGSSPSQSGSLDLDQVGSEICAGMNIIYFDGTETSWYETDTSGMAYLPSPCYGVCFGNVSEAGQILDYFGRLSAFASHPAVVAENTWESDGRTIARFFGVDNYTVINKEDLKKLHETALLSMFDVPQMGVYSNKTVG